MKGGRASFGVYGPGMERERISTAGLGRDRSEAQRASKGIPRGGGARGGRVGRPMQLGRAETELMRLRGRSAQRRRMAAEQELDPGEER